MIATRMEKLLTNVLHGRVNMDLAHLLVMIGFAAGTLVMGTLIIFLAYLLLFDRNQRKHSILRNYPVLGRVRYFMEKIGPELRQYWFNSDTEGKPFSRDEYEHIVKSAKYKRDVIGFGSKRDFDKEGYFVRNDMFPKLTEELKVDKETMALTERYLLIRDPLFTQRVEKMEEDLSSAYLGSTE
jgi:glutamate synthase (ferredoxin)